MLATAEPSLQLLDAETTTWTARIMTEVSPSRLRRSVEMLPAPRSRVHWPEAMARTDQLIMTALTDAGWRVEPRPFAYRRTALGLKLAEPNPATPRLHLAGVNILGIKEGQDPQGAVIVGAHHDTVRHTGGADDNGAGVAALVELARVLAPYQFRSSLILAAFDMEEVGLLGSRALVPVLAQERRIVGAIIYETMAYTNPAPYSQSLPTGLGLLYPGQIKRIRERRFAGNWTAVLYREGSRSLACAFAEGLAHLAGPEIPVLVRDAADLPVLGGLLRMLVPTLLHLSRSDHAAFWEAGLPAIMITDTANFRNPHYHCPSDTPETLDYARVAAIIGATAAALARIAELVCKTKGPDT